MASGTGLLKEITINPPVDTAIYTAGDVLFIPFEVENVFGSPGRNGHENPNIALNSVEVFDVDNEAVDLDLIFFRSDQTANVGALNAAFSPNDAAALDVVGVVELTQAADGFDMINSDYARQEGLAIQMQAAANSTSLWIMGVVRTTPTFTAATDLHIRLGFTRD